MHAASQPAARRLAAFVALLGSAVTIAGCGGPTRSVAAYCGYFYGEGGHLRERWLHSGAEAGQNPLGALSSTFAALPELASFMHELSLRAPAEVAPDVQTLADAFSHLAEQMGSAASNPLGALAGGVVDGLAVSGAEQRVNAYTMHHCGRPPEG
jgi:hypothetical protein